MKTMTRTSSDCARERTPRVATLIGILACALVPLSLWLFWAYLLPLPVRAWNLVEDSLRPVAEKAQDGPGTAP